ncbi:endonuclease/exonuclease/phosphatase family protein [Gilvimarinus sp. 1_MG-2023]|uniref:endonuclease/exonuclease/phosphatase family protein n=1 Tax=Gilvimarinus sp. 1_MG-2023 TaxID=3062638 RepID=UPI0026E45A8F|nr:endonuclease/exonuclease/phosphatase family protein [Gilvimarinus sp. 1_MG-2023]MDO6746977.1 endonuclease/exonuclease/phosphatase family protein [Gilvimarinus sp. 1_MG-2023]
MKTAKGECRGKGKFIGLALVAVWGMLLVSACQSNNPTEVSMPIRVATFNVSMEARNYQSDSALLSDQVLPQALDARAEQIMNIAKVIQTVRPDIVLLNEFDYSATPYATIEHFKQQFLNVGDQPVDYPYVYTSPVNTGELFPVDLDGDGEIRQPADTYGFGYFPGHYGMVLLSRYPIVHQAVRTFQTFRWQDMPDALAPEIDGQPYYQPEQWQAMRLSSKSHWDVPVKVGDTEVHILASHPTPPVFDGPEDRNGRRNHDEIRLWLDYVAGNADYLYDDHGAYGGLAQGAHFVIVGDLNASATEGDGRRVMMQRLLNHPRVYDPKPASPGASAARPDQPGSEYHTAAWGMRADYVLPSQSLTAQASGVFWPTPEEPLHYLVKDRQSSSDHRLVWVDLLLPE